jgi:hypothetical protein
MFAPHVLVPHAQEAVFFTDPSWFAHITELWHCSPTSAPTWQYIDAGDVAAAQIWTRHVHSPVSAVDPSVDVQAFVHLPFPLLPWLAQNWFAVQ